MIPIVSGTVRNAVKIAQLDNKWQQKKESGSLFQKELTPEQQMVNWFQEDMQRMREGNELASISYKLKSGDSLTPEEVEYLQKNAPELYREYMEIRAEKEAYERQLKNCKTKEEVDRLKINKMNGILSQAKSVLNNPSIPKGKKLEMAEKFLMKVMGIQDVHMKFVEDGHYATLPTEEEAAEEQKAKAEASKKVAEALAPEEEEAVSEEKEAVSEAEKSEEAVSEDNAEIAEGISSDNGAKREEITENVVEAPMFDSAQEDISGIFAEVRRELVDFIQNNRPSGYGLEYLTDDHARKMQKR